MKYEEELKLSFYKEIASVDERHGVALVQHAETGKVYVKKTLKHFDRSVFEYIRNGRFQGIPVIKELIDADDSLIVIEDYINGHSLDEYLKEGEFTEARTVGVIKALCDVLLPMHYHNPPIIHRDIKGSNVIIDNEGKVYLIDFDASKLVVKGKNRDTDLIGTEEYAAPEQYGFGQSDQRTDIYAMGILMNKLLTGKFPSEEKYKKGALSEVIEKATSLDPVNRYQNVQELKQALNTYKTDYSGETEFTFEVTTDSGLKKALSHLPYPIRELPGFRSGKPSYFAAALLWYIFLISFGFIANLNNPQYTPAQNRFYDIATFLLLLFPTLYLGNYLGIRNSLPWGRTDRKWLEVIRIGTGAVLSCIVVIILVSIAAAILHF